MNQPMTDAELETYTLHRRFDRMGRLVGDAKMRKLLGSHVMVLGLGGVGSWAAEAVARSGVGRVTIVDFDEVCVTNANRQLHALAPKVGQKKAEVMAERLRQINPACSVRAVAGFYGEETHDEVFSQRPDFVIDAIDHITAKCRLIAFCRREDLPMVVSTGSGGRLDPTQVAVADLGKTDVDPLARELRRILREKHGFPEAGAAYGVPAVYSAEPPTEPQELTYDGGKGFRCVCPQGENPYLGCEKRNIIMGTAGFVTGAFGLAAASVAVRRLLA